MARPHEGRADQLDDPHWMLPQRTQDGAAMVLWGLIAGIVGWVLSQGIIGALA